MMLLLWDVAAVWVYWNGSSKKPVPLFLQQANQACSYGGKNIHKHKTRHIRKAS